MCFSISNVECTFCQSFHFSITILPTANHRLQFTFSHPRRSTGPGILSAGEAFFFWNKLRSILPFWLFSFPKPTLKNEGNQLDCWSNSDGTSFLLSSLCRQKGIGHLFWAKISFFWKNCSNRFSWLLYNNSKEWNTCQHV